jgi:uncharacterized repeat protein (TIGR03803 family)
LIEGTDGNLYGATAAGGDLFASNGGDGTIFKITPQGDLTTLFSFNETSATNGVTPFSIAQGDDGSLFGVTGADSTQGRGLEALGLVYRLSTNGTLSILHKFTGGAENSNPLILIKGQNGLFYGTTQQGGSVFQITPDGELTTLHIFSHNDGSIPFSLIQSQDGRLYGTTGPGGTIFRISVPAAPRIQTITQNGPATTLTCSTVAEQTYQLQYIADLSQTNWNNLGSSFTATNGLSILSDPLGTDQKRFYRLVLIQ